MPEPSFAETITQLGFIFLFSAGFIVAFIVAAFLWALLGFLADLIFPMRKNKRR